MSERWMIFKALVSLGVDFVRQMSCSDIVIFADGEIDKADAFIIRKKLMEYFDNPAKDWNDLYKHFFVDLK